MRFVAVAMLALIACSGSDDSNLNSVLESSTSSYTAVDDPDPRFDYAVTVTLTHRNSSQLVVRVPSCTATVLNPDYNVHRSGSGQAAWDPDITCAVSGVPYDDMRPGEVRTYTLALRAPWQRLFNGQPIGETEGRFFVVMRTQVCASINQFGICTPNNRVEWVRSNEFTINTQ